MITPMKTSKNNPYLAGPAIARFLLPALVMVTAVPAAVATPNDSAPAPKTHTLFLGADISVEHNKQFYRVSNVIGQALVIRVDGKDIKIAMNDGPIDLKVDHALKLTETAARLDNLEAQRSYTAGNDPDRQLRQGLNEAEEGVAGYENYKTVTALRLMNFQQLHLNSTDAGRQAEFSAEVAEAIQDASTNYGHAVAGPNSAFRIANSRLGGEGQFDAMEVNFEASAAKTLVNPYVVVFAQYRDPSAPSAPVQTRIYVKSLQSLGSQAKKVRMIEGGFPPGYTLEKYQLHLYAEGREIATNVADKQVALTRDEAFTFRMLEYVGTNKGATLPAVPAPGWLKPEQRAQLDADQLNHVYYVKVAKDGRPLAAFLDANCSRSADASVGAVVNDLRFYPALEKGRTVEGVAELRLAL